MAYMGAGAAADASSLREMTPSWLLSIASKALAAGAVYPTGAAMYCGAEYVGNVLYDGAA